MKQQGPAGPAAVAPTLAGRVWFRRIAAGAALLGLTSTAAACRPAAAPLATAAFADPSPAPSDRPWFDDRSLSSGLAFVHSSGHVDRYLMPEIMAGGAALFDMDNDGDLDAYLVQAGGLLADPATRPPNQLFRNRGDGSFEDVTAGSGADDRGYGNGVAAGDVDNDGLTDLYVTNLGPNVLLHNEGGGHFRAVPDAGGAAGDDWSSSAAFLDLDRDGDLDLFVVNYLRWGLGLERPCANTAGTADYCSPRSYGAPAQDRLYRNDGAGRFSDVTAAAGLTAAFGNGLGILPGDFDDDGWLDVFVANDQTPNQLWINRGDGSFADQAWPWGVAMDQNGAPKAGMGVDAADIDDDGDLDLLVGNLYTETDSFYRNEGGSFLDATAALGLGGTPRAFTRFGLGWADFDNDGWLDLYQANGRVQLKTTDIAAGDPFAEPNLLWRGGPPEVGQGRLREVLPRGGTWPPSVGSSRAAAFGDVDNDGGVDVLLLERDAPARLLMDLAGSGGHWLGLRILETSGRDALGARLTARVGARNLTREVRSAYSYQAANDPRVHLGLGSALSVDSLTLRWADGKTEAFDPPATLDRVLTLRRGEGRAAGRP